jgi:hypothetical protein
MAPIVGPVQNLFSSLYVHCFKSFVPIAQQAGQAVVLGRLSHSMVVTSVRMDKKYGMLVKNVL